MKQARVFYHHGEAMRPKARVWRKRNQGLGVTAKGSKDLAGDKQLNLMVAIAKLKGYHFSRRVWRAQQPFFLGVHATKL